MSTSSRSKPPESSGDRVLVDTAGMAALIETLWSRGYVVVGPTARDGAIVLGEVRSYTDLPVGWTDEQDAGRYRLRRRDDDAAFGFAQGPQSFRKYLSPPRTVVWRGTRSKEGFTTDQPATGTEALRYAFFGARSCDLHALASQDQVWSGHAFADPDYVARRSQAFIVAVNCTEPGGTCFCTSTGTGPRAEAGFDLAVTELLEGKHRFVVEAGTTAGTDVLSAVPHTAASVTDGDEADQRVRDAAGAMGRQLPAAGLQELLAATLEDPHWDVVAERCLSCANCTLVCPTCFCTTVEDVTDLSGDHAERWRRWDSCFTAEFSYIHGGSVRSSTRSRYRQWLTHKLGTWHDQFGHSGCVGCGRCISWCPVGIDLTQEIAALRRSAKEEA